jgi:hypothetical protein
VQTDSPTARRSTSDAAPLIRHKTLPVGTVPHSITLPSQYLQVRGAMIPRGILGCTALRNYLGIGNVDKQCGEHGTVDSPTGDGTVTQCSGWVMRAVALCCSTGPPGDCCTDSQRPQVSQITDTALLLCSSS